MTAHRPRASGPLDSTTLIEVFFAGETTLGSGWRVGRPSRLWRPPTDMYETAAELVVRVELAGVQPEDLRILLHDRLLTISGARLDPRPERRAYYQMEVQYGEFRTEVELPVPVNVSQVEAEYSQGFLRVTLPKLKPDLERQE